MKSGLVRNLEQIQEAEDHPHGSRLGTLVLVSLGGACLAFALVSRFKPMVAAAPAQQPDPLGELVARSQAAAVPSANGPQPMTLAGRDVTFPTLLSDDARTTTALAAMRPPPTGKDPAAAPGAGSPASAPSAFAPESGPPPASDRLTVMPLPARNVVSPSPLVSRPRDALTQIAKGALHTGTTSVEEGHPGGYQLQASSFRDESEAAAFATALRQRGHHAYVDPAQIEGRGTWYRVRVGPFRSQREAAQYRAEFERKEHLAPFLVEPPKVRALEKPSTR